MGQRSLDSILTMALATALSFMPVAAAGQSPKPTGKSWSPSRTSDGQPDMQGFWARQAGTPPYYENLEEGSEAKHTVMAENVLRRGSAIVDPPDGKVPYQPWAAAIKQERFKNIYNPNPELRDPVSTRCFLAGVPRIQYDVAPPTFRILQAPGSVLLLFERQHAYRVIPLDGRPHVPANLKLWMGDSRGRWQGNTLVVDVTNHNGKPWLDWAGNFHSDALRVVERWTLAGPDTISYEATIEDPKVYSRPWKMALTYARNTQQGYEQMEDACYEGVAADAARYAPRP